MKELAEKIEKAAMPKEVEEQAKKELKRLERMPEAAAEYAMTRAYLEWLIELPWSKLSPERIDLTEARRRRWQTRRHRRPGPPLRTRWRRCRAGSRWWRRAGKMSERASA